MVVHLSTEYDSNARLSWCPMLLPGKQLRVHSFSTGSTTYYGRRPIQRHEMLDSHHRQSIKELLRSRHHTKRISTTIAQVLYSLPRCAAGRIRYSAAKHTSGSTEWEHWSCTPETRTKKKATHQQLKRLQDVAGIRHRQLQNLNVESWGKAQAENRSANTGLPLTPIFLKYTDFWWSVWQTDQFFLTLSDFRMPCLPSVSVCIHAMRGSTLGACSSDRTRLQVSSVQCAQGSS